MGKLAAFGYNEFSRSYSIDMHKKAVTMTGTSHPRVLFIPLCSGNNEAYIHAVKNLYENQLGCTVDTLLLAGKETDKGDAAELINKAQLIFIGDGPNFSAINDIKKSGIGELIVAAFKRDTVVAGEGTGAVYLFEGGFIDAVRGLGTDTPVVLNAQGLGLVNGLLCTGFELEDRQQGFAITMAENENIGFGLCGGCAFFVDGRSYYTQAFAETKGFLRVMGHESYVDITNMTSEKPAPLKSLYRTSDNMVVLDNYEKTRSRFL
ncbi:Type 1 glutamine amidotransferase-like domain-containing protein [Acetanaerobacterium elongatum]|uniref:Peptidase family S51 n=1 Tax=Acetanaerobacterium elongatum TaxID=258515 RepID=A0A1G9VRM6_9FIRM|nr:Type 1 glutamine amidotransferase-like domain-containing protein [Acetanaerobacterium elongatum]SDM74515.1 Peptidase family S51 [Acetanaerobacterium elongatum]